jgi:hypothetical protein
MTAAQAYCQLACTDKNSKIVHRLSSSAPFAACVVHLWLLLHQQLRSLHIGICPHAMLGTALRQAVSVPELHGVLDAETRDWTDGLLPCIFRELNKPLASNKACSYPLC